VSAHFRDHRVADCLHDIINNIARIERYAAGLTLDDVDQDGLRRDAVERCLEHLQAENPSPPP